MVRWRRLRLSAVVLGAALCLLVASAGHTGRRAAPHPEDAPRVAISPLQPGADSAVLPVRAADELRAATQLVPLRALVIVAVLAGLFRLVPARWRLSFGLGRGRRLLQARRHTIGLRAPPLLQFA